MPQIHDFPGTYSSILQILKNGKNVYIVHMTFFHELITLRFNYHSYIPNISLKTF